MDGKDTKGQRWEAQCLGKAPFSKRQNWTPGRLQSLLKVSTCTLFTGQTSFDRVHIYTACKEQRTLTWTMLIWHVVNGAVWLGHLRRRLFIESKRDCLTRLPLAEERLTSIGNWRLRTIFCPVLGDTQREQPFSSGQLPLSYSRSLLMEEMHFHLSPTNFLEEKKLSSSAHITSKSRHRHNYAYRNHLQLCQ